MNPSSGNAAFAGGGALASVSRLDGGSAPAGAAPELLAGGPAQGAGIVERSLIAYARGYRVSDVFGRSLDGASELPESNIWARDR